MTFAEILSLEDKNYDKIYLYKEGSFLKAYEHSAFLFHRHIHEFKLSRRFIKTVNRPVISLGFPELSLNKWFYSFKVDRISDKVLCVDIEKTVDEVEYQDWTELARVQANSGDRFTVHTSIIEGQPVYKTAYDLLGHIIDISKNIEKNMRLPFGVKVKSLSYRIAFGIKTLYEAADRDTHISDIQSSCRELAFLLQLLRDKRQISLEAFAFESERIVSVSKQLEGLRRTVKA